MVKKIVKLIYKIIELKKISNEPELVETEKQLYKLLNKELNRKNKEIYNYIGKMHIESMQKIL
jgi:hypothetical protein